MDKLSYIFSGQGSQYVGMDALFEKFPNFSKDYFIKANDILGYDIYDIIKNGPSEKINSTRYTQPAIFIISSIAFDILKNEYGLPDYCSGHSLGEISSLYACNVLTYEDALTLVNNRARAMEICSEKNPGGMIALINQSESKIESVLNISNLVIANFNSDKQTILSGSDKSIKIALDFCTNKKIKAIKLPVSGAFHSKLMGSASDTLLETINQLNFDDANIPLYQNYDGLPYMDKNLIKKNIIKQLTSPVLWKNCVDNMIKDGASSFIEVGPKNVLSSINKSINKNVSTDSFENLIKNESI